MPVYKTTSKDGIITYYVQFYYKDFSGKLRHKKKRGFEKRSDAKAWEEEYKRRAANAPDMTFQSMYDIYIDDCRKHLKPVTVKNKEFIFRQKILPFFGQKPLNEITTADVRAWHNQLIADDMSSGYQKVANSNLSSIFTFAKKFYNLQKNPVSISGSFGSSKRTTKLNFWTLDEFNKFIKKVENPMYIAIYNILFFTGCRIGELLALTPADFDFEAKTMTISKNIVRLNKKDIEQTPKTSKSNRIISIPDFLAKIVKNYIEKNIYKPDKTDRLFPIGSLYIRTLLRQKAAAAGVKIIRIHDLRHSHASLLINMGCSPLLVQERLGHERIQTTLDTYSHLYPNKQTELADQLQSMVKPSISDS